MGLIGDVKALIQELREERKMQREMLTEILRTSQVQSQVADRLVGVVEGMMKSFDVSDIPSSERHMSEENEALMLEDIYYGGRDDGDGGNDAPYGSQPLS